MGRAPRVLTYSHDGYGLGHLRRNLRVIGGLVARRPDVKILAVTGCKCAQEFSYPPGVNYLRLPTMTKVADDRYIPDALDLSPEAVIRARGAIILDAVEAFEPDLVLVDRHPLGLSGELGDALRMLRRRRPAAHLVLGLRDILDAAPTVRAEWLRKRHAQTIEQLYDSILVYGSRAVYDPVHAYRFEPSIAAKVHFTGYLAHDASLRPRSEIRRQLQLGARNRLALCTLGGGKDGTRVGSAFIDALQLMSKDGWRGLLVTGPYMSDGDRAGLMRRAGGEVAVRRFIADVPSHLAAADTALCMGGYNTLCEALSVNAAVVVVPRVQPRSEQLIRAEAFAARGLIRMIHPDQLTPELVTAELRRASEADPASRLDAFEKLGRRGVEQAASHLAALLHDRAAAASPAPLSALAVGR